MRKKGMENNEKNPINMQSKHELKEQGIKDNHTEKDLHTHGLSQKKALWFVLALTTSFMLIEFIMGYVTNSLALISDAGHMLNDVFSISLGLIGIQLAERPLSTSKTYGFKRMEVLSGFIQGVSLIGVASFVVIEAIKRTTRLEKLEIKGPLMLVTAIIGLVINLVGLYLLHGGHEENLNVKGVYMHVIADALGSVAAITAGILISLFDLVIFDLIASIVISIFIFKSGLSITTRSVHILLESTPQNIDLSSFMEELSNLDGIKKITDIHAWSISSDYNVLTVHLLVDETTNTGNLLDQCRELARKYRFNHYTFQFENDNCIDIKNCYPTT